MQKLIMLLWVTLISLNLIAQEIPEKPNPPRLVNDYVGAMRDGEKQQLEATLDQFARETSTQIVVLVVKDFGGTTREDFAVRVGEKWGVGQKDKDNGLVVVVKPRFGNERGEAFIATGYGLEGAVPDAVVKRLIDAEMIPFFKQGDYYGGINAAAIKLMGLTRGEYTADQYLKESKKARPSSWFGLIFLVILIIFVMRSSSASNKSSLGGSSLPFLVMLGMMGSSRGSHGGSYGNFSGGSGGFGGFGGGSFGGGGAGGSW